MTKQAIVFGPHPDDIEIGAGGTVARLIAAGWQVNLVILTSEKNTGKVKEERTSEAQRGAACLGVPSDRISFCDLPDTELGQVPRAVAIDTIRAKIEGFITNADLIITNTPADSHTDHKAAHDLTIGAVRRKPILLYPIVNSLAVSHFTPRLFVDTTQFCPQKHAALLEHHSQATAGRIQYDDIDKLESGYGRRIGVARAEAFEVIVQSGVTDGAVGLLTELNDCAFHRFWHPILAEDPRLYILYATPVVRNAPLTSRRINYDSVGIDALNSAFASLWYGEHPFKDAVYPAASEGAERLLDNHNVLISGGATSNRFTDRYFNHFEGIRYMIDHTMPNYRDLRVHDRVRNKALRSIYGSDSIGNDTIVCDLGLLTVMRHPGAPKNFLLGCMGVHSPGSLGCFRVLSDQFLLRELMQVMPMPIPRDSENGSGQVVGYQVLVQQELPVESRPARILRDSLHSITRREHE
jgi:LmbE family N-acetylglucosaminyl deacetylase